MSKLRVHAFTISVDGYGAGSDQGLENPLGRGGQSLHEWMLRTRTFKRMVGEPGGETGVADDLTARGFENIGAWIMGRNMFAPSRGAWTEDQWRGWWGEEPPYHAPVFVLTHHARGPIEMAGGTTFHFVTEGAHVALERARAAAAGRDVRLVGGVKVIREYLAAGLIDELHLAIAPIVLGSGEHLLNGLDLPALGYERTAHAETPDALQITLTKTRQGR